MPTASLRLWPGGSAADFRVLGLARCNAHDPAGEEASFAGAVELGGPTGINMVD